MKEGGWKQQRHGGGYIPGPRAKRQGSVSVDEQEEAIGETWQNGSPWDLDLGTVEATGGVGNHVGSRQ